ncbi:YggT family protein [Pseudoscourfieldia marina]
MPSSYAGSLSTDGQQQQTQQQQPEGATDDATTYTQNTKHAWAAPRMLAMSGVMAMCLELFYIVLILRVLLSWFPNVPPILYPVQDFVRAVTDPVLRPIQQVVPPLRLGNVAMDMSVILLILLINWLRSSALPF